jgi:predicted lipid-binding transport protein (Tim44 family)
MKLLATYPSERAARRAVRALEAGGIDPTEIRVDAPQDDRDELQTEQHDEARSSEIAPGVPGVGVAMKATLGGSMVGFPVGAIVGLVIGFAAFRTHFVAVITCMIAFGVAGWVAMALWAVYSAATEKQEATESQLRAQVVVGVHTDDKAEIERAQMILRGTDPHRMDLAS